MNTSVKYTSLAALIAVAIACNNDKSTPGYTFMDDMYDSPSIETYQPSEQLPSGSGAQLPVDGTVPRGYMPYDYPNTPEGYLASFQGVKMPERYKQMDADEGKELYTIFCSSCHGEKGDGNGWLVQQEKILGVPSYSADRLPDITEGSIYHVIVHGKGIMGSHASQINEDERWKIVRYVQKLRGDKVEAQGEETNEQQS